MPARGSNRHRAVRRRGRTLLLGVGVVGIIVTAGSVLAATTAVRIMRTAGTAEATGPACPSAVSRCTGQAVPTPKISGRSGSAPAVKRARPVRRPSTPTPTASPTPSDTQPAEAPTEPAVTQVLDLINQARAQAGLPAYTLTTALGRSAARHDRVMANGCGLSHQCPGEPSLGDRETAAGVPWTTAGENIGEGGPVADSSAPIAQMAVVLTQDMLNEKPPDDGHRENILNSAFHHIGIAIRRDSSGTVWMTQDFSN
jgi:uncharacterized protein YkwD